MNDFIQVINSVGFPVFVAIYMLIENTKSKEKHLQSNKEHTQALNDLKVVIEQFIKSCKRGE